MKKISKNFAWWMISCIYIFTAVFFSIVDEWLLCIAMVIGFIFSSYQYLKYRSKEE